MTEPDTLEDSTALVHSVTLKFGSWCVKEQKTLEDSTALVHCDILNMQQILNMQHILNMLTRQMMVNLK